MLHTNQAELNQLYGTFCRVWVAGGQATLTTTSLDQDEPDYRNKQLSLIAQNYILNTGRFSEKYSALEAARQQMLPQPDA